MPKVISVNLKDQYELLERALIEEYKSYLTERIKSLAISLKGVPSRGDLRLISSGLSNRLQQGLHRSIFRGTGLEFLEVREYNYGDDPRTIDWNVTARFGKLFVRTFIEEKEIPLFFLVDLHLGMLIGRTSSKLERGLKVMELFSSLALRFSEKLGLWMPVERRSTPVYIPPLKGPKQVYRIFRAVADSISFAGKSALIPGMYSYLNLIKRRSFLIIISDLSALELADQNLERFKTILRGLTYRHDLFLVLTLDELDIKLPDVGIVELMDVSTGRIIEVDTSDPELRRAYEELAQQKVRTLIKLLESSGVDWIMGLYQEDLISQFFKAIARRRYRYARRR